MCNNDLQPTNYINEAYGTYSNMTHTGNIEAQYVNSIITQHDQQGVLI